LSYQNGKNLHLDRRNFIKLLFGALVISKGAFAKHNSWYKTHLEKLNKSRRIVAYFDINAGQNHIFGIEVNKWVDFRFNFVDEPNNQIDSIYFCLDGGNISYYPSEILPLINSKGINEWLNSGIDILKISIEETHKRELEAFYSHRMNGSDRDVSHSPAIIPLKEKNPNWLIPEAQWKPGLWNYGKKGVREHKLQVLTELAQNYNLDGIDLDFMRTPPFFPNGEAWTSRESLTELMRSVRKMLTSIAKERGRPYLLSIRIPRNIEGCHFIGIDIEKWAKEKLVDIMIIGTRSIKVDLPSFKKITEGTNIKLIPCFDDAAHFPSGYHDPGIEFERGVFTNWWHQGADSVATFNWSFASQYLYDKLEYNHYMPKSHQQAYKEIGSYETMIFKNKTFVIPRRFGVTTSPDNEYRWNNYANLNFENPLPALTKSNEPLVLKIDIGDDISNQTANISKLNLHLVYEIKDNIVSNKSEEIFSDLRNIDVKINGKDLMSLERDTDKKLFVFDVDSKQLVHGVNMIYLRSKVSLIIEKIELHVKYNN